MKILLINPPRSPHNAILDHAPEEAKRYIHKKLIGPPLGLLIVASAVSDYDVTLLDMKGEYDLNPGAPPIRDLVHDYCGREQPDIVGVTFIASEFEAGMEIFKAVKKYNPRIITVAGGLHATLCPHDFNRPAVDVLCPGQSAMAFREVIRAVEKGTGFDHISGIMVGHEGKLTATGGTAGEWNPALNTTLFPDRSLIRRWLPTYRVGDSPHASTYVFTSLGCPYRCSFCSIWPQYGGKFYQRDAASIVRELGMIDEYGVVRFADANTIVNVQFIDTLFDMIIAEGIEKTYIMDIRFDTAAANPRLISKLARAGLKVVICGFESFREEELKKYKKEAPAKLIEDAIAIFHDNGILVRGNYVVPPDYDERDFAALADYAGSHRVSFAGYTILTPMPGTCLYDEMNRMIVDRDLSKYNFFNCVLQTKLPIEKFYENIGKLWLIKKGTDVI